MVWDGDRVAEIEGHGWARTEPVPALAAETADALARAAETPAGPWGGAWLLTDTHGRTLTTSEAAQSLLAANPGVLRWHHRWLRSPAHPTLLAGCLARALATGRAAAALPRDHRLPLTLRCTRLPPARSTGQVRLLVTLRDPETEGLNPELAQAMFGLTPAEARVAAALANGHSTEQIALGLGVQTNTVLAHIKRVLTKTGAARQVELVSLLLRSAAMTNAIAPDIDTDTRTGVSTRPGRSPCPPG